MGVPYSLPRKKPKLEEKLKELEERNKQLEEKIKLLEAALERPIIVQPTQRVENVGNPKVVVDIPPTSKPVEEMSIKQKTKLPITKLLKPGVFFEYTDEDLYGTSKYTVQNIEHGIIELFEELSTMIPGKPYYHSYFYYIGEDRRCYAIKDSWEKSFTEGFGYVSRKCSVEELVPTNHYINMWVNPFDLGRLDTIPIRDGIGKLVSIEKENGEKLYCFRYSSPKDPKASLHFFYDEKFGLLRKMICIGGDRVEYLVGTNLKYISTYPKPSSRAPPSKISKKYGEAIREAEEFKKEAEELLKRS